MLCLGIESVDNQVLRINKKGATREQAIQAVKWAKEAGLQVWGYFMLGMYGDTFESMRRTLEFSKELPIDIANFAVSAPYPGTEWNRISRELGWLAADPDYDQNFATDVEQEDCPSSLVKKMQRDAYLGFYCSFRGLRLIARNPGSWRFLIHVATDHIRSFAKKITKPDIQVARKTVD